MEAPLDQSFVYAVGKTITEPTYSPDIRVECTNGIHFFMTKQEAVDYHW